VFSVRLAPKRAGIRTYLLAGCRPHQPLAQSLRISIRVGGGGLRGGVAKWSVARNGTIIEQAQILTTHNLALASSVDPDEQGLL
jgi:hypothetical protein